MGYGVTGMLGAKLAAPDRPAVSVCGDGTLFHARQRAGHGVSAAHKATHSLRRQTVSRLCLFVGTVALPSEIGNWNTNIQSIYSEACQFSITGFVRKDGLGKQTCVVLINLGRNYGVGHLAYTIDQPHYDPHPPRRPNLFQSSSGPERRIFRLDIHFLNSFNLEAKAATRIPKRPS